MSHRDQILEMLDQAGIRSWPTQGDSLIVYGETRIRFDIRGKLYDIGSGHDNEDELNEAYDDGHAHGIERGYERAIEDHYEEIHTAALHLEGLLARAPKKTREAMEELLCAIGRMEGAVP